MIRIEAAQPDDYPTFAALFGELDTGEAPPGEAYFIREIVPTTWVARDEHRAALGYAFAQIFGTSCYIRHLVTAPAWRRKGVGRALVGKIAAFARERGAKTWELNVKITNEPAVKLYEGLGMERRYDTVVLRTRLDSLRAPNVAVEVRAPVPTEHAAIDEAFGLPSGLVAKNVADPAKIVLVAFDGMEPVAVASFDPSFPGVFPFRARTPPIASAVLEALAPHARPIEDAERPWRKDSVQVVVEDNEAVAQALLAAGGSEVFRITHLEGPLPA